MMCTVDKMYQDGNCSPFFKWLVGQQWFKEIWCPRNTPRGTLRIHLSWVDSGLEDRKIPFWTQICQIVSIYHHLGVFICKMDITWILLKLNDLELEWYAWDFDSYVLSVWQLLILILILVLYFLLIRMFDLHNSE